MRETRKRDLLANERSDYFILSLLSPLDEEVVVAVELDASVLLLLVIVIIVRPVIIKITTVVIVNNVIVVAKVVHFMRIGFRVSIVSTATPVLLLLVLECAVHRQ